MSAFSKSLRLLVVEDHGDAANALCRLLQLSGHIVKIALSGHAALKLASAERFDLLVSDIGLMDTTGYELLRQLRNRYPIKGISMSGHGADDDVHRSLDAGFSEHFVKPVDITRLNHAIEKIFN